MQKTELHESDTMVQLTNTSADLLDVRCFYEEAAQSCVGGLPDESCNSPIKTCRGKCIATRVQFRLQLTAAQPLAWHVRTGLQSVPLDGLNRTGFDGQAQSFTRIPPFAPTTRVASLRCFVVGADSVTPRGQNALVGMATVERRALTLTGSDDAWQYRAVGMPALVEAPGQDGFLHLGGPAAEYAGCAAYVLLEHFFGGAEVAIGDSNSVVDTTLALTSCSSQIERSTRSPTASLAVFNEFAQRFSTSLAISMGQRVRPLTLIATNVPSNSIFNVGVTGTLAGQTRINSNVGGFAAIAFETHSDLTDPPRIHSAGLSTHTLGESAEGDVIAYRGARCAGDCSLDGEVTVDELISAQRIASGVEAVQSCQPAEGTGDVQVGLDDLGAAIRASLDGCPPLPTLPPTTEIPTPSPTPSPPSEMPEITYLGLATADDQPLLQKGTDTHGRPLFMWPLGRGISLVIEARGDRGVTAFVDTTTYSPTGELPGVQVLASRDLGDGGVEVCELGGRAGGIPGVPTLAFSDDAATIAAINDLGCRAFGSPNPSGEICTRKISATTRSSAFSSPFGPVADISSVQICIPFARAWSLPDGDTIFAVRVRDSLGRYSATEEVTIRIGDTPGTP